MSFPGKRIRYFRKKIKISQINLGQRIGASGNQIGKYERGEAQPSVSRLRAIAEALGISLAQLVEDDPEDYFAAPEAKVDPHSQRKIDPGLVLLPFVPDWDGTWPLPEEVNHWWVPRSYLRYEDCLITVMKDDSMRPYLLPGDALVVYPHIRKPVSLTIVLVWIGGELLVRRFVRSRFCRYFTPSNPCYPTIESDGKGERVAGGVIGLAARNLSDPLSPEIGPEVVASG
jgi:transcriptional regulator with XRE-family HTH domain